MRGVEGAGSKRNGWIAAIPLGTQARWVAAGLLIAAVAALSGCASRMPPVADFMAPGPDFHASLSAQAFGGTRDLDYPAGWNYSCLPDGLASDTAARLHCSESFHNARSYSDSTSLVVVTGNVVAGDLWRVGVGWSNANIMHFMLGLRGEHLGVMGWLGVLGAGGGAVTEMMRPSEHVHLGLYQYYAVNQYASKFLEGQNGSNVPLDFQEAGVGGWVRYGKEFGGVLEARAGKELDDGRWRVSMGVSFEFDRGVP